MNKEEKLLLSLSWIKPPEDAQSLAEKSSEDGLDWDYICRRAVDEGIGPLLYKNLKKSNLISEIPPACASDLELAYYSTLANNMRLIKVLKEAVELLAGHGIRVLLIKGICLLGTIYKDIGLRPLEDADLVIRKDEIEKVKALLNTDGFLPAPNYPEVMVKDDSVLDIHSDFSNYSRIESRRFAIRVNVEEVFARAQVDSRFGRAALRPADADLFILLALHAMKHSFSRYIWFVDLAELSAHLSALGQWDELWLRADSFAAQKPVLYVVNYLRRAMGVEIPRCGPEKALAEELGRVERYFLKALLGAKRLDRTGDLWLLFSVRKKSEMARLLLEIAFPKREIMRQVFPFVPPKLVALAYALRFFQLLGFLSNFLWQSALKFTGVS